MREDEATWRSGDPPKIFLEEVPPEGEDIEAPHGYVFDREIGSGGWGRVSLAYRKGRPRTNDERLAVKVITKPYPVADHLLHELECAAILRDAPDCAWVAKVRDVGRTRSRHPFFAIEYIDGANLDIEMLLKTNYQRVWEIVRIFRDIFRGVEYLAGLRLVHRDLKWSNIMVTPDGVPKIIDFGLLKLMERRKERREVSLERRRGGRREEVTVSMDGFGIRTSETIEGTPAYLSPEQAAGRSLDERSDVFSLALLLSLALSGQYDWSPSPAHQSELIVADRAVLRTPIPRPDLSHIKEGAALLELLNRMLSFDPKERMWPSEVVRRLSELLETRNALYPKNW